MARRGPPNGRRRRRDNFSPIRNCHLCSGRGRRRNLVGCWAPRDFASNRKLPRAGRLELREFSPLKPGEVAMKLLIAFTASALFALAATAGDVEIAGMKSKAP